MTKEYVERGALLENLEQFAPEHLTRLLRDLISKQPAADVVEVVSGRWIEDKYGYFSCDQCRYEHDEPEYTTPFCPNCGAKMDRKENNV